MQNRKKLGTYLTITAGIGCTASTAHAAVVFYDSDSLPSPAGIQPGDGGYGTYDLNSTADVNVAFRYLAGYSYFARADDLHDGSQAYGTSGFNGYYGAFFATENGGLLNNGALVGDNNFVSISFNGDDGIFEAVAQFSFTVDGQATLIAIATLNEITDTSDLSNVGGPGLSLADGYNLIVEANGVTDLSAASSVPEPSGIALLGLGAAGLITRRQRKVA